MSDELQYYASPSRTGATITAKVYNLDGTVLQSGIPCPEVGGEAVFIGDFPTGTPRGRYAVRFYSGALVIGHGNLFWDGHVEVDPAGYMDELTELFGLDPNNPMEYQPERQFSNNIDITVTGDAVAFTKLQRS